MEIPATRGDTLSQPTRARLFELLGDLRRSASTDELARRLGLHPNGVRVHLERLQTAGLVVRERQAVVCALHRGMTRGLLDVIDPKTKLSAFVPKDPDTAGCLIELRGPMAASREPVA